MKMLWTSTLDNTDIVKHLDVLEINGFLTKTKNYLTEFKIFTPEKEDQPIGKICL